MSIVFYDVEEWEQDLLPKEIAGRPVKLVSGRLTPASAAEAKEAAVIAVFSWSTLDAPVLVALPRLKHVVTRSTGFDHIDAEICKQRGITISNVPEYGVRTVAEHT